MDFISGDVASILNEIQKQFSALSWTLIVSAVGISETYKNRQRGINIKASIPWFFPFMIGAIFGAFEYLSKVDFSKFAFFSVSFNVLKNACVYGGLVPIVYTLTLEPYKALIAWIKKKSEVVKTTPVN